MKKAAHATPNQRLVNERLRNHWSQQEVADRIGTTRVNVNRWERGITFPGPYFRQQLCTLFDKSIQELGLLQEEGEEKVEQRPEPPSLQQEATLNPPVESSAKEEELIPFSSDPEIYEPSLLTPLSPSFERLSQSGLSRRKLFVGLAGGIIAGIGGTTLLVLSRSTPKFSEHSSIPVKPVLIGTTLCNYQQHHLMVRCVAWAPDGKYLASAGGDHVVHVWRPDSAVGQTVRLYAGHHDRVNAAIWSPDGTRIASTSDRTVHIWEAATGKRLFSYQGHTHVVRALAWCSNGQYIASGSEDSTVQVWDALTGDHISTYHGHTAPVLTVAWSPLCNRIASGGQDATVQVWDFFERRPIYVYHGHQCTVHSVAWSRDNVRIASGSGDKTVQVWDATTGRDRFMDFKVPTRVVSVAWSSDSHQVAFGGYDRSTVQINDVITGQTLFTYRRHTNSIHTIAWSPDGTRIASGGLDKTVQVWEAH